MRNKIRKYAIKAVLISLTMVLLMRLIISLLFYYNVNNDLGERIYSICYITGFVFLYLLVISVLILVVHFIIKGIGKFNTRE